MQKLMHIVIILCFSITSSKASSNNQNYPFNQQANYEGSSNIVNLQYHMGPVLASPINLYIIWYGKWIPSHQETIKDFLHSFSTPAPFPSVSDWWKTVTLYTDQTGANITHNIVLSEEYYDSTYSHGKSLTRISMHSIIKTAFTSYPNALPISSKNGLYLILTSNDVEVQEFCRAVCGFHYFTFPYIVGVTVPFAWVGYSGTQCPGMCAYPFAWPSYYSGSGQPKPQSNEIMKAPNGNPGIDGMISVIAHELAEVSSNPLVNAWYAGGDPSAPNEIADLCLGIYGSGGGGGYVGDVSKDLLGNGYNLNGVKGRKFLVQWVWNPISKRCFGPNALD